jgi:hypothetical protein
MLLEREHHGATIIGAVHASCLSRKLIVLKVTLSLSRNESNIAKGTIGHRALVFVSHRPYHMIVINVKIVLSVIVSLCSALEREKSHLKALSL